MQPFGKILIISGIVLIIFGLVLAGKLGPLGKLPGDISFSKGNFSFYFPLATSIILSIVISLVFWFMKR